MSSATERARCLLDHDDPARLVTELAEEAERWVIIDLDRALGATDWLVELADACGIGLARARARQARAHALSYANQFEDALRTLESSVEFALDAGEPVTAAQARLAMLHALVRLGRYDEAVLAGESARETFVTNGQEVLAARAEINLGVTHRMRNAPELALSFFDNARKTLAEDAVMVAQIDSNRAEALVDLNRFTDAEDAYRCALDSFMSADVARGAAIVEGNLADLMSRQGRLQPALYHFERSRRSMDADQAAGDIARLEAEQAEAFAAAGLLEEAADGYASAIPQLDAHTLPWEAARARVGFGQVLGRLRRLDEANSTLEEATQSFRRLKHGIGIGRALRSRAELAMADGRDSFAEDLLHEALELLADRPAEAAVVRHHLAALAMESGDMTTAAALTDAAISDAQRLELSPLLADLLHTRSRLRRRQGLVDLALDDLRRAVEEIEKVRGSLQADRMRAAFVGHRTQVYQDLVTGLLNENRPAAVATAFRTVEQAKCRSLLDLVAGAIDREVLAPEDADSVDGLVQQVLQRRRDLNALYSRLHDVSAAESGSEALAGWRRQVDACSRQLQTLESRLASTRGVGGLFAPPIELADVQAMLDERTAIIEYFVAGEELLAFVVLADRAEVRRGLASRADLEEHIERVQFQLSRAIGYFDPEAGTSRRLVLDAQRELQDLYDMVLGPMHHDLGGVERLIVVPHGPLHTVPFHALFDGVEYVVERYEVSQSPSASLLRQIGGTPGTPGSGRRALVMGIPDEIAPQIEEEAYQVARTLGDARVFIGSEATAERLALESSQTGIVHLACHARFHASSPLSSGIRLGDGWLTVRDLYGLRLDGSVVVLSGCDTGRTSVSGADEVVGLVRGFFAAGASGLVFSLWTLSDATARDFMTSVYEYWESGMNLASAIRQSQRELMQRRPHPVFWAPFALAGTLDI